MHQSLFGFDDHEWAMLAQPPLSVVRQPTHALGLPAAELLL
ncbi:MAG: substrate-binding domain-containing protein [Chloroflexota bacterium]